MHAAALIVVALGVACATELAGGTTCSSQCAVSVCKPFAKIRRSGLPAPVSLNGNPVELGHDFSLMESHDPTQFHERSSQTEYRLVCAAAASDPAAFASFLSQPAYTKVLGNVSQSQGQAYLDRIGAIDSGILDCLVQFKTSDLAGANPNMFFFGPSYGFLSGLTLRYIQVLADLVQHFGDLTNFNIVEIGSGFGGQSKIVSDIFSVASYTLVDLPEALALTSRFIAQFPAIKTRSVLLAPSQEDLRETMKGNSLDNSEFLLATYDLCMSNSAFTELEPQTRNRYWPLLKRCTRGYIVDNSACLQDSGLSEGSEELGMRGVAKRLGQLGRKVSFELAHAEAGCTQLVTWVT